MRRVRVVAAAVLGAAVLASCVRPVDVEPTDAGTAGSPGSTSTVTSTSSSSSSGSSTPYSLHETDLPSTLRVAISFDQPGVGLREGDEYSGLDVDVARYIARYLGISRISFVEAIANQRQTLLATDQVDLVIASWSMPSSTSEQVAFAGPYLTTGQDLLVSRRSVIRTPEQLRGFTVCSVQGSSSTAELVADHPGLHLTVQPRVSDCIDLLEEGKVKAVSADTAVLAAFARRSKAPDKLRLSGKPFATEEWGVGVARADTALCQDITDALEDMVATGAWKKAVRENLGTSRSLPKASLTPPELRDCPPPPSPSSSTSETSPGSSG